MRVVEHTQRALNVALRDRELAQLRMHAVFIAQARGGMHDPIAARIVRIAYHQASLAVLAAKWRDSRWHIAMHAARTRHAVAIEAFA